MAETSQATVQQVAAQRVAFMQAQGSHLESDVLLARVRSWAAMLGCHGEGPESVVFLDDPRTEPEAMARYEVWVPVTDRARTVPDDPIQVKEVAEERALVRELSGPHDPLQTVALFAETASMLSGQGQTRAGPARLEMSDDPARLARPEDLRTRFVFPIAAAAT